MQTKAKSKKKTGKSFSAKTKSPKKDKKGGNPVVKQLLDNAILYHNQGNLQQALDSYRSVLSMEPNNPDANHLLGILTNQTGNAKAAITLIRKAIEQKPTAVKFYSNLGLAYKADNRRMEASVSFKKAIDMDPDYLEARINLAQKYF